MFDHLGDIVCWLFVVGGVLEKVTFQLGLALKSALAFSGGGALYNLLYKVMDPATKKIVKETLKLMGKIVVTGILYSLAERIWGL